MLFEKVSAHNHIFVSESRAGVRSLSFSKGGAVQSAAHPSQPGTLELPYTRAACTALALPKKLSRVLVIGLGGGSLPRFIHHHFPEARVDAVELDPEVVSVAKRFFGFEEGPRLRAIVADGRAFLTGSRERWDLILIDAYDDDRVPLPLATREFLEEVCAHLTPGGVAVGNLWSGASNKLYPAMVRTWMAVFEGLFVVRAETGSNNRILIARGSPFRPAELLERAQEMDRTKRLPLALAPMVEASGTAMPEPVRMVKILTDRDLTSR